jgi:hypothetical protein
VGVHDISDPKVIIAECRFDGINHATGKTFLSIFLFGRAPLPYQTLAAG